MSLSLSRAKLPVDRRGHAEAEESGLGEADSRSTGTRKREERTALTPRTAWQADKNRQDRPPPLARYRTRRLIPSARAFCRIAPSVRFSFRPIAFAACLPARPRIVFTSAAVQGFGFFLRVRGILISKCGSGILGRPPLQIVEKAAGVGRRPMRAAYARRRPEDRASVA